MNIIFTLLFIGTMINLTIGIYVIWQNPREWSNRILSLLFAFFVIWDFAYGMAVISRNIEVYVMWRKLVTLSISIVPSLAMHFFMIFSKKEKASRKPWIHFAIYVPTAVFTYKAIFEEFLIKDISFTRFGWYSSFDTDTIWFYAYFLYYILYITQTLVYIYKYRRETQVKREKHLYKTIFYTLLPTAILLIFVSLYIKEIATQALVISLIFFLWDIVSIYIFVKFRLMRLTPSNAAKEIVESIDFMILIDPAGKIIRVNDKTQELLEYNNMDLLNRNVGTVILEESIISSKVKDMVAGEFNSFRCELTLITKEKKNIPADITLSLVRDRYGDIIGFSLVGQDMRNIKKLEREVLKRIKAEEKLRKSEERYRAYFENSLDFIYVIDIETKSIVEANPAALKRFKMPMEEFKSKSFKDIYVNGDMKEVIKAGKMVLQGEIVKGLEASAMDSEGEVFDLELNITPIFENSSVTKVLIMARDVTARKQSVKLKEEIEEKVKLIHEIKEYNRMKTEFFARISHELRTPLNIILSTIQLCDIQLKDSRTLENGKKLLKYSGIMKKNSYRLVRLIGNLIDITKMDTGFFQIELKNCDIVRLIENITIAVARYVSFKDINIVFDTEMEEKIMAFDPEKIERIMLNLLSNAIKSTDTGDTIVVNVCEDGNQLMIMVEDTGSGIPEEKQKIVFERFRQVETLLTRNSEGSGIGLSIVKSLVEMHGGEIFLESQTGIGSRFIVKLPISRVDGEQCMELDDSLSDHEERIKIEFSDIYL